MPSSFSQNAGFELPDNGEQAGLWGETVNLNMEILDRHLGGSTNIALTGTTHTLATSSAILSDGQFAAITFTGALAGANTVTIAPNTAQRSYLVRNLATQDVILTQGSGGNVTIPPGVGAVVFATGGGATAGVFNITTALTITGGTIGGAAVTETTLGGATAAELAHLSGVTAPIQTQLDTLDTSIGALETEVDGKQPTIVLTADRAVVTDGSGAPAAAAVTTTELAHLSGVTAPLQTQLDSKQASLGFTPVQQGTGAGMAANTVKIGWGGSTAVGLLAEVDSVPQGKVFTGTAPGAAPMFACRAWGRATVDFIGGGVTSWNGGSISNIAAASSGVYDVTFSTPMPDANYSIAAIATGGAVNITVTINTQSTSGFQLRTYAAASGAASKSGFQFQVVR